METRVKIEVLTNLFSDEPMVINMFDSEDEYFEDTCVIDKHYGDYYILSNSPSLIGSDCYTLKEKHGKRFSWKLYSHVFVVQHGNYISFRPDDNRRHWFHLKLKINEKKIPSISLRCKYALVVDIKNNSEYIILIKNKNGYKRAGSTYDEFNTENTILKYQCDKKLSMLKYIKENNINLLKNM